MRPRGLRRDDHQIPYTRVRLDVRIGQVADTYDVAIIGGLPPGATLWHGTISFPLQPVDESELQWAARQNNLDLRAVKRELFDTIRGRNASKPPADTQPRPRTFKR